MQLDGLLAVHEHGVVEGPDGAERRRRQLHARHHREGGQDPLGHVLAVLGGELQLEAGGIELAGARHRGRTAGSPWKSTCSRWARLLAPTASGLIGIVGVLLVWGSGGGADCIDGGPAPAGQAGGRGVPCAAARAPRAVFLALLCPIMHSNARKTHVTGKKRVSPAKTHVTGCGLPAPALFEGEGGQHVGSCRPAGGPDGGQHAGDAGQDDEEDQGGDRHRDDAADAGAENGLGQGEPEAEAEDEARAWRRRGR